MKIECIESDIEDFIISIEDIHHKQSNTDNAGLVEEAAELKQKIMELYDQMEEMTAEHDKKVEAYNKELELINYIKWAQDIKEKKQKEWDAHKEERKKQKLR